MTWEKVFENVKSDFCGLLGYNIRGNTLEIQTSVVTIGNQFVSVFISNHKNDFVISDGGWVDQDYYGDSDRDQNEEDIFLRVEDQLRSTYNVSKTRDQKGTIFNFKRATDLNMLSLVAFEMAHFVAQLANARLMSYGEEKVPADRQLFVSEVNSRLRREYGDFFSVNDSLSAHAEEVGNIKFNAIIRRPARTSLLMYITGSTHGNFLRSAAVATVNFQIANKDFYAKKFNKVAIINSRANGFNEYRLSRYLQELRSETSSDLLDYYKSLEELPRLIAA